MSLSKSNMDGEKDNPIRFSSEAKDWADFKQSIQSLANRHDTTWLFEGGRALSLFFARRIKEKNGSIAERKRALSREVDPKRDSDHVPTSCDDTPMKRLRSCLIREILVQTCSCHSTKIACKTWAAIIVISNGSTFWTARLSGRGCTRKGAQRLWTSITCGR